MSLSVNDWKRETDAQRAENLELTRVNRDWYRYYLKHAPALRPEETRLPACRRRGYSGHGRERGRWSDIRRDELRQHSSSFAGLARDEDEIGVELTLILFDER
jgi:hypothetical protein